MNHSHIPVLYLNPEKQTPSIYTIRGTVPFPQGSAVLSVILTILDQTKQVTFLFNHSHAYMKTEQLIGHFPVTSSLRFKARLSTKPLIRNDFLNSQANKTHFHNKSLIASFLNESFWKQNARHHCILLSLFIMNSSNHTDRTINIPFSMES